MSRFFSLILLGVIVPRLLCAMPFQEIRYPCSADNSLQPAMFYAPDSDVPVPLVVGLHSWSFNYRTPRYRQIAEWCVAHGWAYIQPDFRGPNNRPEATGSDWVVQDILDAVRHARDVANIDEKAVFLFGFSGGGMAALLMAGRHPEIWAGVSAWVPIIDLAAWHAEAPARYQREIEASCGGPPGASVSVDREYRLRSPVTYLENARSVPIYLSAGILDGHGGRSVPISHSLHAFNLIADPADRIGAEDLAYLVDNAAVPTHLQSSVNDQRYGDKEILFRRASGQVMLTLFDGGHEIIVDAVMPWFQSLRTLVHNE